MVSRKDLNDPDLTQLIDCAVVCVRPAQKLSKKRRRSRCAARWSPRCFAANRPVRPPNNRTCSANVSNVSDLDTDPFSSSVLSVPVNFYLRALSCPIL